MKVKCLLLVLFCGLLSASEYALIIKQSPANGLLKQNGEFSCALTVKQNGKVLEGRKIRVRRLNAFGENVKEEQLLSANPLVIKGKADKSPDWFQYEFSLLDEKGKLCRQLVRNQKEPVQKRAGFLVDHEKFTQTIPEPADYELFWKKVKDELKQIPFTVTSETLPLQTFGKAKIIAQDVKVSCTEGIPVSGYLAVPQNAAPKSLPAVLLLHGAGVRSASLKGTLRYAAMGAVAFDMNAHGIPNGKPDSFYKDLRAKVYYCPQPDGSSRYALRYIRDPRKYYFKGMYQRVMRALELLKRQPQWNGKDLIVIGGSQGGAQAFAAAGLDPQVTLMVAGVPAFSEFGGAVSKFPRMAGWPLNSSSKATLPLEPEVLKCTAYYDNANFAKRIKADAYVTAGLCDMVCPPCGIVASFANLKSKVKFLQLYPQGAHGTSPNAAGMKAVEKILLKK